jgi:hypothetical protein
MEKLRSFKAPPPTRARPRLRRPQIRGLPATPPARARECAAQAHRELNATVQRVMGTLVRLSVPVGRTLLHPAHQPSKRRHQHLFRPRSAVTCRARARPLLVEQEAVIPEHEE